MLYTKANKKAIFISCHSDSFEYLNNQNIFVERIIINNYQYAIPTKVIIDNSKLKISATLKFVISYQNLVLETIKRSLSIYETGDEDDEPSFLKSKYESKILLNIIIGLNNDMTDLYQFDAILVALVMLENMHPYLDDEIESLVILSGEKQAIAVLCSMLTGVQSVCT